MIELSKGAGKDFEEPKEKRIEWATADPGDLNQVVIDLSELENVQSLSIQTREGRNVFAVGDSGTDHGTVDFTTTFFHVTITDRQPMTLDQVERAYVEAVLQHYSNHKTKAVKHLGISMKGLFYKLHQWGIMEKYRKAKK